MNKQQNSDNLKSKKTEFYERQEQREADRLDIKDGFSFLDKETYDSLPLTKWLDKSENRSSTIPNYQLNIKQKNFSKAIQGCR